MLFTYLQSVQRLLADETQMLFNPGDLIDYVNKARLQTAGEGECIRGVGSLSVTAAGGMGPYDYSAITNLPSGVNGVFKVRQITYAVGSGAQWVTPRPYEWFTLYYLNNPTPGTGTPSQWTQLQPGGVGNGTLYVNPAPNATYTLNADVVGAPAPLAADTDPEAIPASWQQAVMWLACYWALVGAPLDQVPQGAADRMYARYREFLGQGRRWVTPDVLPGIYPQTPDSTRMGRMLGAQSGAGGGGGGGGA